MSNDLFIPLLLITNIILLVILLVLYISQRHRLEQDRLSQEHSLASLGSRLLDELDT